MSSLSWFTLSAPGNVLSFNGNLNIIGDVNATGEYYVGGTALGGVGGGGSFWSGVFGAGIYYAGGPVGLGKTNPNPLYRLDVAGDVNISGQYYRNGVLFTGGGGGGSVLWSEAGGVLTTDVKVGINTTNPLSSFHVHDSTVVADPTKGIRVGVNSTFATMNLIVPVTGTPYFLMQTKQSSGPITVGNLSLNPEGGFVGIGKTNPGFTLDVNGNVNIVGDIFKNGFLVPLGGEGGGWISDGPDTFYPSTGNVGVGTAASVGNRLQVNGNINFSNTANEIRITGTPVLTRTTLGSTVVNSSLRTVGDLISLRVDNDTLFVNQISKNVGIGKVTPNYKLDVQGIINASGGVYSNGAAIIDGNTLGSSITNSSLTSLGTLTALTVSGNPTFAGGIRITKQLGVNYIQSGQNITSAGSSADLFIGDMMQNTTDSIRKFMIKSNGNVGIGTDSPEALLTLANSAGDNHLLLDGFTTPGDGKGGVFFRSGFIGASNYNCSIFNYDLSGLNTVPDGISINGFKGVTFCSGGDSRNERMRITQSGNVGIGTTNPPWRLDVNGDVNASLYRLNGRISEQLIITPVNLTGVGYVNTSFYPVVFSSGGPVRFDIRMPSQLAAAPYNSHTVFGVVMGGGFTDIEANGEITHTLYQLSERSVGGIYIGTASFTGIVIYLRGNMNYTVRSDIVPTFSDSEVTVLQATFAIKDANMVDTSGSTTNSFLIWNGVIENPGKTIVNRSPGIPTLNVENRVTIRSTTSPFLRFERSNPNLHDFEIGMNNDDNLIFRGGADLSTGTLLERMRIQGGTGNVGIGTNNPGAYRLQVQGDLNFTGELYKNGVVFTGGGISQWTTSGSNIYYTNGNVGIGTTVVSTLLTLGRTSGNNHILLDGTVHGDGGGGVFFRSGFVGSSNYNCSIFNFNHHSTASDGISINGFDGVSICTGSNSRNERMRISHNGNVGIGTLSPQSNLHVVNKTNPVWPGTWSVDGIVPSPTRIKEPPRSNWSSVTWSPQRGLFVAVASTGGASFISSMFSHNGLDWNSSVGGISNLFSWSSVTWSPQLGMFVAVASTGIGQRAHYSYNGTSWTSSGVTGVPEHEWRSVAWSPELGIFVAVASPGSGSVIRSSNGINWTATTDGVPGYGFRSVAWSPELGLFVAVSDNQGAVMRSSDGITWMWELAPSGSWTSVVWSPELGLFVVVGASGLIRSMYSSDGITFTTSGVSGVLELTWRAVVWASLMGLFVAVDAFDSISMYSLNGINWSTAGVSGIPNNGWTSLIWAEELGKFVAVGTSQTLAQVMYSDAILNAVSQRIASFGTVLDCTSSFQRVDLRSYSSKTPTLSQSITLNAQGGNVGIGTTNPTERLVVRGAIRSNHQSEDFTSGGTSAFMDMIFADKLMRIGTTSGGDSNTGTRGEIAVVVNNAEMIRVNRFGYMGIGTADPTYPLDVSIAGPFLSSTHYYGNQGFKDLGPFSFAVSIRTPNSIVGGVFVSTSDSRIKSDMTLIDDGLALRKLRLIEPHEYSYIDKVSKSDRRVFGFIAQQVREHFPEAVSLQRECIPNVYHIQPVDLATLTIYVPGKAVSGKLRVITSTTSVDLIVEEVDADHVRFIEGTLLPEDLVDGNVFVYGFYVDDFHILNKDYLFTIGFASTQELDRQLQSAKAEIQSLKEDRSAMQETILQLQAKLDAVLVHLNIEM